MIKNMATNLLRVMKRSIAIRSTSRMLSTVPAEAAEESEVLLEEVGNKGLIILNRPRTLNSLNLSMVEKIYPVLKEWESTKDLVIVRGSGDKSFCAGGDVKSIALALRESGGHKLGHDFFRAEYTLNYLIGTYKKPYVALMNGITMGGGVGLSVHGKYRIATEKTLFAMPETAIGLFPDVGGSHFLPKLQGKLGLFLGLTGQRLQGSDVFHAGIATHFVASENLENVVQSLLESSDAEEVLKEYARADGEFSLAPNMDKIDAYFSEPSILEIMNSLRGDGSEWAEAVLGTLNKMSPTSLRLTRAALNRGSKQSLAESLIMEFRLACSCVRRGSDFYEGVRALLIDKDMKPVWNPRHVGDVSDGYVEKHFAPMPEGEELQLAGPSHL